jgi:predicted peptidase
LLGLLDEALESYWADSKQMYITGLSMGGYGAWHLTAAYPHRFAAIVPICGGGDPAWAEKLKPIPVWAIHGVHDDVVPLEETVRMVKALEHYRGNVRLTVYPYAGHDAWTAAYREQGLYAWLLSHTLPAESEGGL